ncbi:hypothetical protein VN97_g6967 [Penicillium thymicola]|uniref:Uncharacterized protein n=1 Tax=Penicillium thymicola TaxID=293382 RepID=A0AAI9X752_PENTH|nr:hypothetical protein VN97_g6967 [Penicillium thymicola]
MRSLLRHRTHHLSKGLLLEIQLQSTTIRLRMPSFTSMNMECIQSLSKARLTFGLILALHPPPSVEDGLDGIAFAPANLPLDLSSPTTLEHRVLENNALNINVLSDDHSFHIPSYYPLPNPDTFELTDDDDDAEMAGSLGRFVEAQREDNGVHFEAGGSGALVEPQFASRQVVNQDFRLDFAHLDLVPDGSPNPNYVPTTRDRSSDLDAASRRSTPR